MKWRHPLIGLAVIGLIPALAIIFLIRLEEGQLVVGGQALAEYDLPRLIAGLLSTMRPIWLLAAPAMAFGVARKNAAFWATAFATPFLLLGPSLIAGLAVGGTGFGLPSYALAVLGLMTVCFVLWSSLLAQLCGIRAALIIYGAIWAASGYLGYLNEYILPYLELPILNITSYLIWLLPQLQSGPDAIDNALQAGAFEIGSLLPTLIQLPILGVLLWLGARRPAREGDRTDVAPAP